MSIALTLASVFNTLSVLLDAPAAEVVGLVAKRPKKIQSLLVG